MTDKHHVGPVRPGATEEELRALGRELYDKIHAEEATASEPEEPRTDSDVR